MLIVGDDMATYNDEPFVTDMEANKVYSGQKIRPGDTVRFEATGGPNKTSATVRPHRKPKKNSKLKRNVVIAGMVVTMAISGVTGYAIGKGAENRANAQMRQEYVMMLSDQIGNIQDTSGLNDFIDAAIIEAGLRKDKDLSTQAKANYWAPLINDLEGYRSQISYYTEKLTDPNITEEQRIDYTNKINTAYSNAIILIEDKLDMTPSGYITFDENAEDMTMGTV